MKKLLIIVSVLFVAIIMMITTPDKQPHNEAMMSAIRDFVDDEADSLGLGDNVLTDIGKGIVNKTVEKALNMKLEMHDYLLFNTTYVKLKGEEQMLSLGLFGHVITFDKKMLRTKLEEALNERAAVKQNEKELKELQKEKKKREKELEKERRKAEKDSIKEAKRMEKERRKAEKDSIKAAKRQHNDEE